MADFERRGDILLKLAYAPASGLPARLSGQDEVVRFLKGPLRKSKRRDSLPLQGVSISRTMCRACRLWAVRLSSTANMLILRGQQGSGHSDSRFRVLRIREKTY